MLFYCKNFEEGGAIAIWKIEESIEQLLSYFSLLKVELEEKISSMGSEKRIKEFLAVRVLISRLLGIENSVIYNQNGRPSLLGRNEKISISHTNGYATVIIHPNRNVGVDIEQFRDKILRVKNKFLSPVELSQIDSKREKDHLILLWSAKEALYKLSDNHLVEFDEDMEVEEHSLKSEGKLFITDKKSVVRYEFFYEFFDDFVLVYGFE